MNSSSHNTEHDPAETHVDQPGKHKDINPNRNNDGNSGSPPTQLEKSAGKDDGRIK